MGESTFVIADPERNDSRTGGPRSLPVQVWYPSDPHGEPAAPYAAPKTLALAEQYLHLCPGQLKVDLAARQAPNVRVPPAGGWPVLVYSGTTASFRMFSSSLVQSLASYGYIVFVVDHPFDAVVSEYPNGRIVRAPGSTVPTGSSAAKQFRTRVEDLRFVVGRLSAINAGTPVTPVRAAVDIDRIGMMGHGWGGAATVHAMLADPRIRAGVNLDGSNPGSVPDTDLDRPLLTIGSANGGPRDDPGWGALWAHLRGRHRELTVRGTGAMSFTDAAILAERWDLSRTWSAGQLGRLSGRRAVQITVTYVGAFFEQAFGGRPSGLLDHEDPTHPEVVFTG